MRDIDEILPRVQQAVADTLCIDLEEAAPATRFFTDIDGESIEWLDLSFRLDKEFGVRIPGLGNYAGIATDDEGRFTAGGIAALRVFMPASLLDRIQTRVPMPTAKELAAEITISDIAGMVQMALESKSARQSA
jgi:acyl carrier protein